MIKQLYFKLFIFQKSFVCTQFKSQTVLLYQLIGSYKVPPLWTRVDLGAMAIRGTSYFPKHPHYWSLSITLFYIISSSLLGEVLPLCRDAVGVFYNSSRLSHRTLIGWVLPLCKDAVGIFYNPSRLGYRTLVEVGLNPCRDTVSVFYNPNRRGHRTLVSGCLTPRQR